MCWQDGNSVYISSVSIGRDIRWFMWSWNHLRLNHLVIFKINYLTRVVNWVMGCRQLRYTSNFWKALSFCDWCLLICTFCGRGFEDLPYVLDWLQNLLFVLFSFKLPNKAKLSYFIKQFKRYLYLNYPIRYHPYNDKLWTEKTVYTLFLMVVIWNNRRRWDYLMFFEAKLSNDISLLDDFYWK